MFNKILYIGAGNDITPLMVFPTSNFVYVDSRPRNEYGYDYYYRGFYSGTFKRDVIRALDRLHFQKVEDIEHHKIFTDHYTEINVPDLESHLETFQDIHSPQTLRYYFSTGIPKDLNDNETLCADIASCDAVLIKGHWPHHDVLRHLSKPFHFIGAMGTYFPEERVAEEKEDEQAILFHFKPSDILSYSCLTYRDTVHTFSTYSEFYSYYKNKTGESDSDIEE